MEDCLADAEEKAREEKGNQEKIKQENPADDKTTKEEEAEVKREPSETPTIETITTIASPPKDV